MSDQPRIIQTFCLDTPALEDAMSANEEWQPAKALRAILHSLVQQGYELYGSSGAHSGLPLTLQVITPHGNNPKADFLSVANTLKLPYSSGDCYMPMMQG